MKYFKSKIDLKQVKFSNLYEFVDILYDSFKEIKEVQDLTEFCKERYDILVNIKIKEPKNNSRFNLETQVPILIEEYNRLRNQGYEEKEAAEILQRGIVTEWFDNGLLDLRYDKNNVPYKPKYHYIDLIPSTKSILYMADSYYRDWYLSFRQFKETMKKYKWDFDIKRVENAVKYNIRPRKLKVLSEKVLGVSDNNSPIQKSSLVETALRKLDLSDRAFSKERIDKGKWALLIKNNEIQVVTRHRSGFSGANTERRVWISDETDERIINEYLTYDGKYLILYKTVSPTKYYELVDLAKYLYAKYKSLEVHS